MEKKSLTYKQKKLYDIILEYISIIGVAPTIRELSFELDRSRSTIHEEIDRLIDKGYLVKTGKKRGLKVINNDVD